MNYEKERRKEILTQGNYVVATDKQGRVERFDWRFRSNDQKPVNPMLTGRSIVREEWCDASCVDK